MKQCEWRWLLVLRHFFPLMLMFALSACHEEMSPLTSGELSYDVQSGGFINKELSSNQLQELAVWLKKHSDDWRGCYATYSQLSIFSLSLKHANGNSSFVTLLKFENTSRTLMARHLDGSNMNDQRCALLSVTEEDINALRVLLPLENLSEPEFDKPSALKYFLQ
ncbi:MAG: hypothetical protein PHP57_06675 [Sideroxydans sp.]|nr:hypothetical protein [Sideroxydans sp.]